MNRRPVSGAFRRWVSEDSTGSFRLAALLPQGGEVPASDAPAPAWQAASEQPLGEAREWTGVVEEDDAEEA